MHKPGTRVTDVLVCIPQNNHHVDNISAKMAALRGKVSELERAAAQRKAKLDENSAFLQFNWKADVVESWIGRTPHRRHTTVLTVDTTILTMDINTSMHIIWKLIFTS